MIRLDEEKLEEVGNLAIEEWLSHYKDGDVTVDETDRAMRSVRLVLQYNATKRIGDATQFAILRSITEDPDQMAEYISVSLPHLSPAKQLKSKK